MDTLFDWSGRSFKAESVRIRASAPQGEAHLYVIGYSSGTIKVGYSRVPGTRIGTHAAEAIRHGVEVTSVWVSESHGEFVANEEALKTWCDSACSGRLGAEYFTGISTASAVEVARSLTGTRADQASDNGPALPPIDPLQLLTSDDVAALMQMSKTWVEQQATSGALRRLKAGANVRFRRRDVEAFQESLLEPVGPVRLAAVADIRAA